MGQVCAERAASPAVAMAAVPPKMGVEGLNLYYRDFHALKDINLSFPANKVTALIGLRQVDPAQDAQPYERPR